MLAQALLYLLVGSALFALAYWSRELYLSMVVREYVDVVLAGALSIAFGTMLGIYVWTLNHETDISIPFRLAFLTLIVVPIIKRSRRKKEIHRSVIEAMEASGDLAR